MTVRLSCIIFAISTLVGVAVRSLMVFFTIDPVSGFMMPEYFVPNLFICITLGVTLISVFVSAMFVKTKVKGELNLNNLPLAVAMILLALGMGFETFFSDILVNVSRFQTALHAIITLLSMAALVAVAVFKFLNKPYPPIITLVPVAFWVMRLIVVFTGFSTISTISDTVIETATMCLSLAVFLFFAKIECAQIPKSHKLFFATSLLCATLSLIASVPRAIVQFPLFIEETIAKIFPAFTLPEPLHQLATHPIHPSAAPFSTGILVAAFSIIFAYSLLQKIKE